MARYIIDYNIGNSSGIDFVEAETAQEAVDAFTSYMPSDEDITIMGVYRESKNWRVRK